MHIDAHQRSVRLSVGELATFRNLPSSDKTRGGTWRPAVGVEWHRTAQEQTRKQHPDAQFEVSLKASWQRKDWTFELHGRMDQLVPQPAGLRIREVKTIRGVLPAQAEDLMRQYPEYFAQAAIYTQLARVLPEFAGQTISSELVFIDIDTATVQTIPLSQRNEDAFEHQLDTLLPFLEDRRDARLRLNKIQVRAAFATLREGQAELFQILKHAALQTRTVMLEAPTGFGKTGIVLEHSLRQMQQGIYERCIYLTSKSTGQLQIIQQLQEMIGDDLRFIQMRNRAEHKIDSPKHRCSGDTNCEQGLGQHWFEADIRPAQLFEHGTLSLERAKSIGAETGICPYSLSKSCLPFAEIWIGDSNYVFSPGSNHVFNTTLGFDPAKTLLIVDEAHNLPNRTADALSVEINAGELLFALEELGITGAPRRLIHIGNELARSIDKLPSNNALNSHSLYQLLDLCEDFEAVLIDARFDNSNTAPFAIDLVWRIPEMAKCLSGPAHRWLHWCPTSGTLRSTCLDASEWIAECLQAFGGSILMSATLAPYDTFRHSCGLNATSATLAQGHAAWRDDAYTVAIDTRVDTRLQQRDKYYETTARTVALMASQSPGIPIAVFFSSYQYAENIKNYLSATDPELRVLIQPRGINLAEQESFIDEGLLTADALFLILGSSYAEGVDKLGGRIQSAMVVGPALPEVNCVQQAKMDAHPSLSRDESFRDVYIIPAMQRIHQALGRLVRAPGHRAKLILHGKRYAEAPYRSQLAPEYQNAIEIRNDADLLNYVAK